MKRMVLFLFITILSITITACNASNYTSSDASFTKKQLSQKEKLEDFEYMYNILKENYPFFDVNKRRNGVDWLEKKDEYINLIKSGKDDIGFYNSMSMILNDLHNSHTHMFSQNDYSYFKGMYTDWGGGNEPWLKQLNNEKVLVRYRQDNNNNQTVSSFSDKTFGTTGISQNYNFVGMKTDIGNSLSNSNVQTKIIEKDKVAYLSVKGFDYYNIEKDGKIIQPFLNSIKGYNKLIIDIRGNGGGNDKYWSENIVQPLINKPLSYEYYWVFRGGDYEEDFIRNMLGYGYEGLKRIDEIDKEGLVNEPPELKNKFKYFIKQKFTTSPTGSINFKGKIYLLVDKYVSSSAEAFAIFSKSTGFATLVGEKTGGDGIVGNILVCALPNSGYVFSFSMTMGLTSTGNCNEEFKTEPDIEISQRWLYNLFEG